MKIKREKKQDDIYYYGNGIRIEATAGDDEISIWDESRGQMPPYGRLDIRIIQVKELIKVLPEFIKEMENQS